MIYIKDLYKSFTTNNRKTVNALENVNIVFPENGLFSVVGKSGSGKTTLLNILAGLTTPTSGDYYIGNINTSLLTKEEWSNLRSSFFGFVFQNYNLVESETVFNNLKLTILNENDIDERIDKILLKFGLEKLKNEYVNNLSGGEKQRIAIARACLKKSKIILADEPTASLDEENSTIVFETLKEVSKDALVLVVTHDIEFAEKYSDKVLKIKYGKIDSLSGEIQKKNYEIKKKAKFNFSNLLFIKKIFLNKQKLRRIFSIIFSSIMCSLLSFSGYYILFDHKNLDYRITQENNSPLFISSSEESIRCDFSYNQLNNLKEKYKKIEFYPTYTNIELSNRILVGNLDSIGKYDVFIDSIALDNSLEDNKIETTDFVVENLKYGDYISGEKGDYYFNFFGENYQILDSINTHFLENDHPLYEDDAARYIKVNEKTFLKIEKLMSENILLDSGIFINSDNYLQFLNKNGLKIEKENEIVLSSTALGRITGSLDSLEETYLNSFVGTKVTINDESLEDQFKGEFTIAGVYYGEKPTYFYKSSLFKTQKLNPSTFSLKVNSENAMKKIISELKTSKLYLYGYGMRQNVDMHSYVNATKIIYYFIGAISLLTITLLICFFNALAIKQNKNNIGICDSIGISTKVLNLAFNLDLLISVFTSAITSLLFSFIFMGIVNARWKSVLYAKALFTFNPFVHLIIFIFISLVSFVSMALLYKKISKYDTLELIKKE